MDMGHVLGAGQFAVRDVEEISSSGQATEKIPGSTVGLIVRHVAAGNLEVQGNCTVLGHPFSAAIQGLAGEEHVLEQERDSQRRSDSAAPIGAWKVRSEKFAEAHAFEELIDVLAAAKN